MIEWIKGPWKLLLAVAILAVSIKWLVLPGVGIARHSGTIDHDLDEIYARMKPIDGTITDVDGHVTDSGQRTYYAWTVSFEARPPERAAPLRGKSLSHDIRISEGDLLPPAGVPKRGDAIKLWYDPQGDWLSDTEHTSVSIPALWIGLVLLGFGLVGVVIAAILVRLSIRRPTRAPA